MKKIFLLTGFLLAFFSVHACEMDGGHDHFRYSFSSVNRFFPEFLPPPAAFYFIGIPPPVKELYAVRGGSFDEPYVFHRYLLCYEGSVYHTFSMIRFQYPKANVFCRMENTSCNRYGVMFSLHAGSTFR